MLSPMMEHYLATKKENPDCILFYRLGDFYEMFFDDALTASRELELTLTGKDCGLEERAPMCGVPFHAAETYISRLVEKGYKVAVAEQMEDPKLAKGLVKREVIRIVTPGTLTAAGTLDESRNNYLCCIVYVGDRYGLCFSDITTGEFKVTETDSLRELRNEIAAYAPAEVIYNRAFEMTGADPASWKDQYGISVSSPDDRFFDDKAAARILCDHFNVHNIEGLGLKDLSCGLMAAGACMQYIYDTQKNTCPNITELRVYRLGEFMVIDNATRRNLELTETMRNREKRGTLLWVLDHTETAMGARLLRSSIEKPLIDIPTLKKRQDAVEELLNAYIDREELKEYLHPVYDLERLMGRISSGLANPRDLLALKTSISMLPHIRNILSGFKSERLRELCGELDTLEDMTQLLEMAVDEEAPITMHDGGIIKPGYNAEADRLRNARTEGKTWLTELEDKEKELTGIKSLRIKYNKVFGYYIEVTNSFKDMVPDRYIRKQTLVGAERFTTDELKELEDVIVGAQDRLIVLEYDLFTEIRRTLADQVNRIQSSAHAIAETDMLISLATAAYLGSYSRPKLNDKGTVEIKDGRHPVVEKILGEGSFICNDTYLDTGSNRVDIITGPNMAGKSTYMRQVALIVLMAQIGSFVPAASANIGICDRIFTRVGASDDLAAGQSTFMVEMSEVAGILRNATRKSLIIMDEIGRGTSTFDGLSIAWAVVEYISNTKILGAKTLFATHYHELTELEGTLSGVHNYCVAVKEQGDDIIFLRKIVKGGADRSYGIQVARLAGLPESVLARAKELVSELSGADIAYKAGEIARSGIPEKSAEPVKKQSATEAGQLSLFETVKDDDIITEIGELDISVMTPIDALNTLYRLQNKINNRIQL